MSSIGVKPLESSMGRLLPAGHARSSRHALRRIAGWTSLALLLSPVSCQDDRLPLLAGFEAPSGEPKSLRQTFDFLREAHARKQYLAMRPYIEPAQRDSVTDMLLAVDELMAANAGALRLVQRASPDMPARAPDLSILLDRLELFSRQARVVEERQEDQAAVILIQTVDFEPPQEVDFRRLNGHWVYVPGPGIAEHVKIFRDLAKAVNRVSQSLAYGGAVTPEQVEYEYRLRILPRLSQHRGPVAP